MMTIYVHLPDGRRVRLTRRMLIYPQDCQFSGHSAPDRPMWTLPLGQKTICWPAWREMKGYDRPQA